MLFNPAMHSEVPARFGNTFPGSPLLDGACAEFAAAEPPPEILVAHTWRFVREDEDFLDAVDAVFDRHTVPAEDLHPRFREGRGGDTSIMRLVPRRRPP